MILIMASQNVYNADHVEVNAPETHFHNAPQESGEITKERKIECLREFARKLNEACENKTGPNVVSEYGCPDLKEPEKQVFPGLLQVDFYKGMVNASKEEYNPESNFAGSASEKWKGKKIDFSEIHAPVGKERCRCSSLVGGAGSGKTTLLKRYARKVLEGKITLDVKTRRFSLRHRQNPIVHFINVRELPEDSNFSPCDLLFKEFVKELSEEELKIGYQNLISHHDHLLFVVDGLDQYDWELEKEVRKIDYFEEASITCIMYNLLTGELFPNARILSSSRPHKIRYFTDKLRAKKMITLSGFESRDMKYLADEIPKTDKTVYKRLTEKCPNLLNMCRTPLFLIFTILVFVQQEDFSSDTMAAVMVVLIKSFGKSIHSSKFTKPDIFTKLKRLAYNGTVARKVLFKDADFKSVGLDPASANELFIHVPKKTGILVKEEMSQEDYVMFFCHQSIQEAFCSFYIFEMPVEEFEEFVDSNIHKPHFSVVRRLLCGILLNEDTLAVSGDLVSASADKTDLEEKRRILLAVMKKKVVEGRIGPREFLDFLSSLYEAGSGADTVFQAFPRSVSVCREPLSVADAYVLGKSLGKLTVLDLLELWDTNMDREQMEVLWQAIRESNLKIKKMDLHSNYQHDFDCGLVGNILHHCEVEELDINDCQLDDGKLKKFGPSRCHKLKRLALSKNEQIGVTGIAIVGQIISRLQEFGELKLDKCNLTKTKLKALQSSLDGTKINKLDINYNRQMGKSGANIVGRLVCECKTTELDMSRCDQTPAEIKSFAKGLKDPQLTILSITTHELRKFVTTKYLAAVRELLPHVSNRLEMLDWDVPPENLAPLQQSVNDLCCQGFKLVYSSLPGEELIREQTL